VICRPFSLALAAGGVFLALAAPAGAEAQVKKPVGGEEAKPDAGPAPSAPDAGPRKAEVEKPPEKPVDPPERVYRKRRGDFITAIHVRPGDPKPGRSVEVILELYKASEVPDPTYGDRIPIANARLIAAWNREGDNETRYLVRPMGESANYGVHLFAAREGPYTLKIEGSVGEEKLSLEYHLGVGQPANPSGTARGARGNRTVVKAGGNAPSLKRYEDPRGVPFMMRELTRRWLDLDAALERAEASGKQPAAKGKKGPTKVEYLPSAVGAAQLAAKSLGSPAAAVVQTVPEDLGSGAPDYNGFARDFVRAVIDVTGKLKGEDLAGARTAMRAIEENQCTKCHAQFSWKVAKDVKDWPKFMSAQEGKK
jgi:hypothetical protein